MTDEVGSYLAERAIAGDLRARSLWHSNRETGEKMQAYLPGMEAEQRRIDLAQWYTPAPLAARVWDWCSEIFAPTVLEPSAGRGSLIAPMLEKPRETSQIVAVEADPRNVEHLRAMGVDGPQPLVVSGDFMAVDLSQFRFNLAVLNPPYEDGQDVAFILRALDLAPRAVALLRADALHSASRYAALWSRVQLRRLAVLVSRPRFGGDGSPKSDFVVVDVERRGPGWVTTPAAVAMEWWA